MKIIGITRVRNEAAIIKYTLNHVARMVDSIIVYDDCSTDDTAAICEKHDAVAQVIRGKEWDGTEAGRGRAEGLLRQIPYEAAVREGADWIYYFDADEYADFDGIDFTADGYRLRLFDYYITPEDNGKHYLERRWLGPEYRDILMLVRVGEGVRFNQRIPNVPHEYHIENAGWVKHYGKAISIEEWEKTCDYYINHRGGPFKAKWEARRGKAVHTISDFNRTLITWEQRHSWGVPLNQ